MRLSRQPSLAFVSLVAVSTLGCETKTQPKPAPPAATAGMPNAAPTAVTSAATSPAVDAQGAGGGAPKTAPLEVQYRVQTYPPAAADGEPARAVLAKRAGEDIVVLPRSEGACLEVLFERDLDGDGWVDAIVEHAVSCGGNLSPSVYLFVAGTPEPKFVVQELGSQWQRPSIEDWKGRPSIVLVSNNAGANVERPERTTRRYVFQDGRAVLAQETRAQDLKALAELRSEVFAGAAQDDERTLEFDLDADGKPDRVVATFWERWGSMFWQVRFGDGRATERHGDACKRIGVLPEKSMGHHDLVCHFDTRYRWNGSDYVEAAAPKP